MPTLLNRLVRAAGLAVALVLAGTALGAGLGLAQGRRLHPVIYPRYLAIGFLEVFLAGYFVDPDGWSRCAASFQRCVVWRSWSRVETGPLVAFVWVNCSRAGLGGGVLRQSGSPGFTVCRRCHSISPSPTQPADEILIVVIGESSALGVPYDGWLSVGAIIGHELQKAIPRVASGSRSWPRKGPRWRRCT